MAVGAIGGPRHYTGPDVPRAVAPLAPVIPVALPQAAVTAQPQIQASEPTWSQFLAWYAQRAEQEGAVVGGGYTELQIRMLMYEAFHVGASLAQQPAPTPRVERPLEGTMETRTVIAALEMFIDQVLSHNPEEVKAGEWLTVEGAKAVIDQIRADVARQESQPA